MIGNTRAACLDLHQACAVFKGVKLPPNFPEEEEEANAQTEFANCADHLASAYEAFLDAVNSATVTIFPPRTAPWQSG